jgi:glutathione reductase (NADPH)
VELLVERTRRLGVTIRLGTAVTAIERSGGSLKVQASAGGEAVTVSAEMVVHSAGRGPNVADLGLEAAGIEYTRQGVTVNEYLQSVSSPAVYSAGDSAHSGGASLTPVAGYEGRIVAANLLDGNHSKPDYNGLASVAFTVPPLAAVGLSEDAARSQGLRFRVLHEDTSGWYSSRRIAEECSGFKLLVEEETGRILGAHILGDRAEEVINLFALAIRYDLTARHLSETLFSYPTHSSDIQYMV